MIVNIQRAFLVTTILGSVIGCSSEVDKAKGEFLSGCINGGASKSVCTCAYDRLADHYGEEQLAQITKVRIASDLPPDWIDRATEAGVACSL